MWNYTASSSWNPNFLVICLLCCTWEKCSGLILYLGLWIKAISLRKGCGQERIIGGLSRVIIIIRIITKMMILHLYDLSFESNFIIFDAHNSPYEVG